MVYLCVYFIYFVFVGGSVYQVCSFFDVFWPLPNAFCKFHVNCGLPHHISHYDYDLSQRFEIHFVQEIHSISRL